MTDGEIDYLPYDWRHYSERGELMAEVDTETADHVAASSMPLRLTQQSNTELRL